MKEPIIEQEANKLYLVLASDNTKYYAVCIHNKAYCDCTDFTINYSRDKHHLCKHIKKAQDYALEKFASNAMVF
jgi:predicted nucleic acid-binding Zn finger protein